MKRKPKPDLRRYLVTIEREIRHRAEIEVEAESADVATQMAQMIADEPRGAHWHEDAIVSQTSKVKPL